ncbi:MAG: CRTAC1 family protein, partial [Rhodothermales bacterium]
VERARLAAEQGDAAVVEEMLDRLAGMAGGGDAWPQELQDRLSNLREAAARNDGSGLSQEIAYLKNDFQRVPSYREQLADVEEAAGREGAPITRFVRLPVPRTTTADPDTAMYFTADSLAIDGGPWDWVRPLPLAGDRVLTLAVANGQTVKLGTGTSFPFPGGPAAVPPGRNGITAADCDNDYRADLVLAGEGGLRLYRQERLDTFNDVTAEMNLPEDVRDGDYSGVWAVDLDMDGDLDLVLSSTVQPTRVLGNDGDGTFTPWALFDETDDVVDFVWADLDGDEVPDAALLDASGGLHVYRNLRTGRFEALDSPSRGGGVVLAVTAADLDGDGRMELAGLEVGGAMARYSFAGGSWTRVTVARWDGMPESPSVATLFAADLDNNGGVDLLAVVPGGGQTWLADADGRLVPASISVAPRVFDVADLGGTGRLDLIGLSSGGQPVRMINVGVRNYASKGIQLRAERTTGDRRINSFGIGGTVEIRSGLLYQKRRITGPVVHFGLGERDVVDVARIIWPNGTSQVEFDLETDQTVLAQQRLKGSCPWIFTHDGTGMRFVTDFLWRTALGLRINAQPGTNVIHSVDWVKIDGDLLRPRNGFYDVRITAELWETHFFDHVALMTVDRPAGVGVFVDERFVLPAPDPELFAVAPLRSVAGAWDHRGRAVTDLVRDLDGRYLDTFDLGPYQGVAEPHFVEVALGDGAAESGPIRLVASGWVRPTDSSINLAVAQGSHDPPRGLRLDVPDGTGGWKTVDSDLGFPAGKSKTIVIDLDGVFPPDVSPRVRLHTNMEVYWDRIAWSVEAPQAELRTERIVPHAAELRYRGFSTVRQDGHSSPELPDYDALTATSPQWLDLSGYHTRLGDVSELVGQ